MTYSDAIEKVLIENGYYAPLKLIYQNIWKYKDIKSVKGKTPNYTVQERVQRDNRFTRIGLGVYALTGFLNKLSREKIPESENEEKERMHSRIQGMLLEIGNNRDEIANTYTNDKNSIFNEKKLGNLSTRGRVPEFTYAKIIQNSVRFIDVLWFNERGFPSFAFEVESSTNFRSGLIKFSEIQDFMTSFYFIADTEKRNKFEKEITKNVFKNIRSRCYFLSYEKVEKDYEAALANTNIKGLF